MKALFPVLFAALILAACGKVPEKSTFSRMKEDSPEYRKAAETFMWKQLKETNAPVDSIKVDGPKLHLRLSTDLSDSLSRDLAKMNALVFNRFKREHLGYTGVTVNVIGKKGIQAHAIVP